MIQYLFIDSIDRNTPYGNAYSVTLKSDVKNVTQIDLVSASVPNVLFNITQGNNIITCDDVDYSIPLGGYNAVQLAAAITTSIPHMCDYVPLSYQGLFVFSNLNSQFTLTLNTPELKQRLGFTENTVTSVKSESHPLGQYYTGYIASSTTDINLTTSQYALLDIDELRTDAFVGAHVTRTFGPIPMDVPCGSIKTFKEQSDYSYSVFFKSPIPKLSRLTIRWTDADGNMLPFNGLERNSIVLRAHTLDYRDEYEEEMIPMKKIPILYILGIVLVLVILLVSL
jgi:hypothetical protein